MIDAHLHLWDPALLRYDWLEGDLATRFGPEHLPDPASRSYVFVQAGADPADALREVDWVLSLDLPVHGIVAHADLERGAAVAESIEVLRARPRVVGVRRLLQSEARGFATAPAFLSGLAAVASAGLTFDACVRAPQLDDVTAVADALPHLTIVLDHLGKPSVGSARRPSRPAGTEWLAALRALGERPRVACKLSGLPAESAGPWGRAQLEPFLDAALEAFGPDRLLVGSDWPVSDTAGYGAWFSFVEDWARDRIGDTRGVMGGNAARVYGLPAPPS